MWRRRHRFVIGSVLHVRAGGPGGGGGARAAALTAARPDEINGVGERLLFLRLKYRNAMVDGTIASRSKTLNPARRARAGTPSPDPEARWSLDSRRGARRRGRRGAGSPPPPRLTVAMDLRSGTMLLPQNSLHPLNFFSCAQRYAHMHSPQSATHTVYAVPPQFLHANNSTNGTKCTTCCQPHDFSAR